MSINSRNPYILYNKISLLKKAPNVNVNFALDWIIRKFSKLKQYRRQRAQLLK